MENKRILLTCLLLCSISASIIAEKLTVVVHGIEREIDCQIFLAIYTSESSYKKSKPYMVVGRHINGNPTTVVINDLPPCDLAIVGFQDFNKNNRLDISFERFGTSGTNNKKSRLPKFDQAKFSFPQTQEIHIQLH